MYTVHLFDITPHKDKSSKVIIPVCTSGHIHCFNKSFAKLYEVWLRHHGQPLSTQKLLVWGERVSAVACMSTAGILDMKTLKGTNDGDEFYRPTCCPTLGCSMPYSVIILDNCLHHVPEIIKSIEDVGILVVFLPY